MAEPIFGGQQAAPAAPNFAPPAQHIPQQPPAQQGLGETVETTARKRGRPRAAAPQPALAPPTQAPVPFVPPQSVVNPPGQPIFAQPAPPADPPAIAPLSPPPKQAEQSDPQRQRAPRKPKAPATVEVGTATVALQIISPQMASTITHLQGMVIEAVAHGDFAGAVRLIKSAGVL